MPLHLSPPFGLAPMAGMTDTAFRRLVKRQGGCGLVVTEMVSSEGLVRGIDRTLEYAEFTDEERPVSVQIFGGDPEKMARAAQVVEALGADAVDVNMGCPVPKIAKHNAGCSLMREPEHAAEIVAAMTKAVRIPVTVKMRAGWNEDEVNAPDLARRMQDAGAAAVTVHGRTAAQSYSGLSDWDLIARVAQAVSIPVFGNGDCIEPEDLFERLRSTGVAGVLVGRGVLRNPWIFAQAAALADGRPVPEVSLAARGRFLLDYMDMLLRGDESEPEGFRHRAGSAPFGSEPEGFRHRAGAASFESDPEGLRHRAGTAPSESEPEGFRHHAGSAPFESEPEGIRHRAGAAPFETDSEGLRHRAGTSSFASGRQPVVVIPTELERHAPPPQRVVVIPTEEQRQAPALPAARSPLSPGEARGRERWVINKVRALSAWYTRGFENGSHLRHEINRTNSLPQLRETICSFFGC